MGCKALLISSACLIISASTGIGPDEWETRNREWSKPSIESQTLEYKQLINVKKEEDTIGEVSVDCVDAYGSIGEKVEIRWDDMDVKAKGWYWDNIERVAKERVSEWLGTDSLDVPGWHYIIDSENMASGWYFTNDDGSLLRSGEQYIDGNYFVFDKSGLMKKGWVQFRNKKEYYYKYYDMETGARGNGWIYYLGAIENAHNDIHKKGFYYLKNGRPFSLTYMTLPISNACGIATVDGNIFCFDRNGLCQSGIVEGYDGTEYQFSDIDGLIVTKA